MIMILVLGALIMVLSSCQPCDSPFTKIGSRCCLDLDEDGICDDSDMKENAQKGLDDLKDRIDESNITNRTIDRIKDIIDSQKNRTGCIDLDDDGVCDSEELSEKSGQLKDKVADILGMSNLSGSAFQKILSAVGSLDEKEEACSVDGVIDFSIDSITIKNRITKIRDDIAFYLATSDIDKLESADLQFEVDCANDPRNIWVYLEDEEIYDDVPYCRENITVEIPIRYIGEGRNELRFTSEKEDLFIKGIKVTINTSEDAKEQLLPSILLEQEDNELKNAEDIGFSNYRKVDFRLDDIEMNSDVQIELNPGRTQGKLITLVNDKQIREELIAGDEISVPKEFLKEGRNTIELIVISE